MERQRKSHQSIQSVDARIVEYHSIDLYRNNISVNIRRLLLLSKRSKRKNCDSFLSQRLPGDVIV